jgi:uncharacterized repeat protein (TIGR01451 family)
MELKRTLASLVLAVLVLAEANAGIIPGFDAFVAVPQTEASSSNFVRESALPKEGKTWIASITCTKNGQQQTVGNGDPESVVSAVNQAISANNLGLVRPDAPIVRSDGGWDSHENLHLNTLSAVCQILGFDAYVSSTCRDEERSNNYPDGKCNFHTPGNDHLFRFSGVYQPPRVACQDGIDNDGDGAIDLADFGCGNNPNGVDEGAVKAQCQDGLDNDGDGLIDYPEDPACESKQDNDESPANVATIQITDTANDNTVTQGQVAVFVLNLKNTGSVEAPSTLRVQNTFKDAQGNVLTTPPFTFESNTNTAVASCAPHSAQYPHNIVCQLNQPLNANGGERTFGVRYQTNAGQYCNQTLTHTATVNVFVNGQHQQIAEDTEQITIQCAALPQCSDGIDNDGDGLIDFPNDPGCSSANDNDEQDAALSFTAVKTTNKTVAARGDLITYTITAKNTGNTTASNIRVRDNVPAGTEFVTQGTTAGCTLHNDPAYPPVIFCPFENYAANQSRSYTLVFRVKNDATCNSLIDNVADVQQQRSTFPHHTFLWSNHVQTTVQCSALPQCSDGIDNDGDGLIDFPNDPGCSSPQDDDETNSVSVADIFVTKSGSPSALKRGENVTYTIQVGNSGTANAENIVLRDTFPSDLEYVSASGATCTLSGNAVQCQLGAMAPNDALKTITMTFKAKTLTSCTQSVVVTNTATVTTTSAETSTANNSSFAQTTINCPTTNTDTDLAITKTGPSSVTFGQNVTYTLTVQNNGNNAATNVVVTDTYPGQMVYLAGSSSSQCAPQGNNTVRCSLASLAAGQQTAFTLVFQIGDPPVSCTQTSITNNVTVSATNTDPVSSNNSASATSTLTCQNGTLDQLSIYKTDGRSTAYTQERLRYMITVSNNQSTSVSSATVTDNVPSGLSIISVSDSGQISGQTVTWNNLTFTGYQSRTFYIDVEVQDSVSDGTVITNTATVGTKQATDATTIKKIPTYQPPHYNPPNYPPIYYPPVSQPPVYYPPVSQPPSYYPPVSQPPSYYPPIYNQPNPGYTPPIYVYPETGDEASFYADASGTDELTALADQTHESTPFSAAFYATLLTMMAAGSAAASRFLLSGGMMLG